MNKNLIFFWIGTVAAGYFAGRYSAPEKIKIEKEIQVVEKSVAAEAKDVAVDRVTHETFRQDGSIASKATRTRSIKQSVKSSLVESDSITHEKRTIENRRGVTVSILAGAPFSGPVYGASVFKQLLGPFVIGAWAFTDLRVGLSVGMEF